MRLDVDERPIFQMRLGLNRRSNVGFVFPDEEDGKDSPLNYSPAFTIAWRPDINFKDVEYVLPGEIGGEYVHFYFRFEGGLFVLRYKKRAIRFALWDAGGPQDFRGMPFFRAFPYVGKTMALLDDYGKSDVFSFVPLTPVDLLVMDHLYRESRTVFVGVTPAFGPHQQTRKPTLVRSESD